MNVKPEYCQVFEDTENGFKAVKNAGMILTDVNKYL
jgi:beta-phosphoglucomutase-like phosphatase (HAD superfamily)